jgi:hypothetical protein
MLEKAGEDQLDGEMKKFYKESRSKAISYKQ